MIFSIVAFTVLGCLTFGLCYFVQGILQPLTGKLFSFVIVVVLFFVLLILSAGIIPYPGPLEPQGGPRFFNESR